MSTLVERVRRAVFGAPIGIEVAVEAEKLGADLLKKFPKALFVAGQIIFEEDTAWNRLLHNVLPVQLDIVPREKQTRSRKLPAADAAA